LKENSVFNDSILSKYDKYDIKILLLKLKKSHMHVCEGDVAKNLHMINFVQLFQIEYTLEEIVTHDGIIAEFYRRQKRITPKKQIG